MYKKSPYYSGVKVAQKIFYENIAKYGADSVQLNEKVQLTCAEYASNMKLTKTKKGVELTKGKREFYQGMFDFFCKPTYSPDIFD